MPNYFTMKMRGGTESPDDRKTVTDFVKETSCIGVGEPEYTTGAGTFQNDIQIGDIVVLRAGGRPLALLKVISDTYQYKPEGKFPDFDNWLDCVRKVKIISWYDDLSDIHFDARGYLQACAAITGDNLPIIQKWYEKTNEIEKIIRIEELMKSWEIYFHSQEQWKDAIFVTDGPFPHYFTQKIKILFIGRELPQISDVQGLEIDYIAERMVMQRLGAFQSRLLYLAYGILNRECNYEEWLNMPEAKELNTRFAEDAKEIADAFSYAFMNASKILNTESTYVKDGGPFRKFTADKVNREFFIREIELLEPDIIISGNLNDMGFYFQNEFKDVMTHDSTEFDNENRFVWKYKFRTNGKTIPCLDVSHFSAIKGTFEGFYQPICEAAKLLLGDK